MKGIRQNLDTSPAALCLTKNPSRVWRFCHAFRAALGGEAIEARPADFQDPSLGLDRIARYVRPMPRTAEPLYAADHPPENDPTLEDLQAMAGEAFQSVPESFRRHLGGVVIRVADWPEDEVLEEMGFDSPYELLGLYQGRALTDRGANDLSTRVDMIFLYREPILDYWEESGFDLRDIVRNTLVHEIGHHFGLSDEAMDALEAEAAEEDKKRRSA